MLSFSVYDSNTERNEKILSYLKEILNDNKIKRFLYMCIDNFEKQTEWPSKPEDHHMFMVSLDMPNAIEFAYFVYKKNPFCKIVFYGEVPDDINLLLKCRPVAIADKLSQRFKDILSFELLENSGSFHMLFFESRNTQIVLPIHNIIYLFSEQHYINVVSDRKELNERFKGKLDDVQKAVHQRVFLRIHKSYLISLHHFVKLNKKAHTVLMDNGDLLSVSDFYYKDVIKRIREFCPFKVE